MKCDTWQLLAPRFVPRGESFIQLQSLCLPSSSLLSPCWDILWKMRRASQTKNPPGSPALLLFSPPLPRLPGRPPLFPPLRPLLPSWSRLPPSGESEPTEDNSDWESFRASRCLQSKVTKILFWLVVPTFISEYFHCLVLDQIYCSTLNNGHV